MAAPSYTLSQQERSFYATLYSSIHGGPQGVSADAVVNLFAKATPTLSTTVLGEVWNLADYQSSGTLTTQGFEIACRLVGHGQAGQSISQDLINRPGPLPKFEGFSPPALSTQPTGQRSAVNNTSFVNARVTPADREKFLRIFQAQSPYNGLLGGDKASQVFLKSNLPPTTLADIWRLADTKERGELDATDFIVGMHLVQKVMSGSMQAPLPALLPPGLYESAAGSSTSAPALPPSASVPRQLTGQPASSAPANSSPLRQQYTGQQPFGRPGVTAMPAWSITPAEKMQSDGWFDGLPKNGDGLIEGPAAVEFFMKSTLDQTTLAAIWDLSDMRNSGTLNKDEFAVATRLINDQLDGKPLPTTLPTDLIPLSQRGAAPPAQQSSSAVERDLFSLLDDDEPVSSAPIPAVAAPRSIASPPPRSVASPTPSASRITSPPPAISRSATQSNDGSSFNAGSGVEIGNLKNQLASTTSSLERTRNDRAQVETVVNNSSSDLASLQAQLEAARTAYTTESSLLSSLQTRAATQTSELAELRSKLITAESDLSGLRVERAEVEQSVLRDKEEIRGLKAKIAELDRETERLRAEAEGKKKEARQQKGMVAITKKQVERSEETRDRARSEVEAATPAPGVEGIASPVSPASSVRSTNPFERMNFGAASTPIPALSPQPTGASAKALSPQPTGSRTAPPPPPSRGKTVDPGTTSLGGTATALAAGAAAAMGAVTSGVASMVSPDPTEEPKPLSASPQPRKSTEERFPEIDDTGVAPTSSASTTGFDDAFAEGPTPTSQAPASTSFDDAFGAAPPSTGFDDAFGVDDEPSSSGPTTSGFDDAFASSRSSSKPVATGFDDAFGAPAPVTATSGAGPSAFDDAFGERSASPGAGGMVKEVEPESDSDDEEDGPEPAEGWKYGRRAGSAEERSPFDEMPAPIPGGYGPSRDASVDPPRPPSAAPSSIDAFEDAQQHVVNSPAPAQSNTSSAFNDDFDAFDREFDDLPTASTAGQAATVKASTSTAGADDEDDFAKEFDRLDDFAPPPATTATVVPNGTTSESAFDSAFAEFDQPSRGATDGGFDSAFDDSFGATPAFSAPSGAPPSLPPRSNTTEGAKEDDAPDVKEVRFAPAALTSFTISQVCALGFSRTQAITALEKSSYNVQAAINSLLDGA